ncbi:hypothetical protein BC629DRAFT_1023336 [Irpex lacteus]|nr:hypothetical protein BC629DRAFT_1023336 [Irpex lacteus]
MRSGFAVMCNAGLIFTAKLATVRAESGRVRAVSINSVPVCHHNRTVIQDQAATATHKPNQSLTTSPPVLKSLLTCNHHHLSFSL